MVTAAVTVSSLRAHPAHSPIGLGAGSGGVAAAVAIGPVRNARCAWRASQVEFCTEGCQV